MVTSRGIDESIAVSVRSRVCEQETEKVCSYDNHPHDHPKDLNRLPRAITSLVPSFVKERKNT
eukprot:5361506-Amphidinium_carterae.1